MRTYDDPYPPAGGSPRAVLIGLAGALLISALFVVAVLAFTGPQAQTRLAVFIFTPTATPTATPSATATATASAVPASATPAGSASATPTASATPSPTPTPTPSPTPTATLTPTPTPTATPWPTPDGAAREIVVPILMYHHIGVPPPDANVFERDLTVRPEDFAAQLAYLRDNGYTVISLYDLQYALALGWPLPERPVIVTFDDGYRDAYDNAYPLLQQAGFSATFFIVTDFVDNGYEAYLSWEQIEAMAAGGMRFEPHSRNHADLRGRDRDFLVWQILGPRETLAAHLGYQPRFFAYPSGHWDGAVVQILKEAEYWGALTTAGGVTHRLEDLYAITRVRVRGGEPIDTFARTLPWP